MFEIWGSIIGATIILAGTLIIYGAKLLEKLGVITAKNLEQDKDIKETKDDIDIMKNQNIDNGKALAVFESKMKTFEKYQENLSLIPSMAVNIKEIKIQAKKTNGTVIKNENDIKNIYYRIGEKNDN